VRALIVIKELKKKRKDEKIATWKENQRKSK
jgi:hypothetical protein